eukprot:scaffold560357_cov18-Prasinocladus_malaysianus.AAC.1
MALRQQQRQQKQQQQRHEGPDRRDAIRIGQPETFKDFAPRATLPRTRQRGKHSVHFVLNEKTRHEKKQTLMK